MQGLLRIALALAVGGGAWSPLSAETRLQNVVGFDATLLSGKTCYGPFSNGQTCDKCRGALVLRFEVKGDLLVAHFWQRWGQADYDRGTRYDPAKTHWRPHLALYQDGGESTALSISGTTIRIELPNDDSMIGTYLGNGRLSGSNSLSANFTAICS
jgi:hypothetical protein